MEGFHPFLIKIVESFLSERKKKTKCKNELSNMTILTCDIPQGTKIGPTLFLLLYNMIATWHKDRAKFADDLKMIALQKQNKIPDLQEMVTRQERDFLEKKTHHK